MVFLLGLFTFIIIIFIFLVLFGKIEIEINNLNINYKKHIQVNSNYKITIKLCLFKKITIIKRIINRQKIDNSKINSKIKNINLGMIMKKEKVNTDVIKIIIKDMIEIVKIKLNIQIGTKDAGVTAVLVGIVSSIISIVFRMKIENIKDQYFKIRPIYNNENVLNIGIDGIFTIKLIHIINIIYILIKGKGDDKNAKSSNRKSYGYSYE